MSVLEQVNTTDHNALSNLWSTGTHVYGHGCQLSDTTPKQVFQLAFDHDSRSGKQWFDGILKNQTSSNNVETEYVIGAWSNTQANFHSNSTLSAESEHGKPERIQERRVTIRANESGLSFFNKKAISVTLHQTAFHNQDCITIYSLYDVKPSESTKLGHHTLIDRWTIKRASSQSDRDNGSKSMFVALGVNMIAPAEMDPAAQALIQSKWLNFFQSRFETWRSLLTEHIRAHNVNAATQQQQQSITMESYCGTWNKLHSFHSIEIMKDRIVYSDGSAFEAHVDADTKQIVAIYGASKFVGKLQRGDKDGYDIIQWSNNSVWIRDGFRRFAGQYLHSSTQQKYIIHANGVLQLPITNRKIRFQLLSPNGLCYPFNRDIVHKGVLNQSGHIEWQNGVVWKRVLHTDANVTQKTSVSDAPVKRTAHQKTGAQNSKLGEKQTSRNESKIAPAPAAAAEKKKTTTETCVRGQDKTVCAAESQAKAEESDHDFEHNFDECLKENEHTKPSLNIQNDAHFVLINRDDIDIDAMNDKVDEWLLV